MGVRSGSGAAAEEGRWGAGHLSLDLSGHDIQYSIKRREKEPALPADEWRYRNGGQRQSTAAGSGRNFPLLANKTLPFGQ